MTDARNHNPPPDSSPKASPETLVLRARPRRIARFRRGVLIGGAAAGAVAIAGVAWMALSPPSLPIGEADREPVFADHRNPATAIAGLPAEYDAIPQLGPPLPGDLGGPILEHQRQLGLEPGDLESEFDMVDHAAEAERQRLAAQALQAREAGVLALTASRPPQGSAPSMFMPDIGGIEAGGLAPPDPQSRMAAMIGSSDGGGTHNPHRLETPASPWQVMAGSVIPAALVTGINSDLPGVVVAQVTEDVRDTVTGRTVLIPQGSRLIGRYESAIAFGQSRAFLVWNRIILPDGASIRIDNLPATDAGGFSGLEDQVDHHTMRMLRGIGMSTLLGVGTELALGSSDSDLVRALRLSTQQSANQAGQQLVGRHLDIQPTIRIRPGWPLRVVVHKDLVLRPWTGP
ncbi:TrbI/VirB10 family protein [Glycocaulis profundi]|nr:TrbI/VirB10 family protein [Glycocaulis profundi]